jgi:hypothetical protein
MRYSLVPTNEAIQKFVEWAESKNITLTDALWTQIIALHIVAGTHTTSAIQYQGDALYASHLQLSNSNSQPSSSGSGSKTYEKEPIPIGISTDPISSDITFDPANSAESGANLLIADYIVSNGVMHVIDEVLVPPVVLLEEGYEVSDIEPIEKGKELIQMGAVEEGGASKSTTKTATATPTKVVGTTDTGVKSKADKAYVNAGGAEVAAGNGETTFRWWPIVAAGAGVLVVAGSVYFFIIRKPEPEAAV